MRIILAIAMAFVLAAPCTALADKKQPPKDTKAFEIKDFSFGVENPTTSSKAKPNKPSNVGTGARSGSKR